MLISDQLRFEIRSKQNATICNQGDLCRHRHHLDGWLALAIGSWDKVAGRQALNFEARFPLANKKTRDPSKEKLGTAKAGAGSVTL